MSSLTGQKQQRQQNQQQQQESFLVGTIVGVGAQQPRVQEECRRNGQVYVAEDVQEGRGNGGYGLSEPA